eukprot:Filipodium_phascolosomae@DN2114_c0_g1_i2.p1
MIQVTLVQDPSILRFMLSLTISLQMRLQLTLGKYQPLVGVRAPCGQNATNMDHSELPQTHEYRPTARTRETTYEGVRGATTHQRAPKSRNQRISGDDKLKQVSNIHCQNSTSWSFTGRVDRSYLFTDSWITRHYVCQLNHNVPLSRITVD